MMRSIAIAVALVITLSAVVFMSQNESRDKEGYWQIVNVDGVWWFKSPKGQLEFLNSVQTVQPFQESKDKNGLYFKSSDYNGDISAWAEKHPLV